MLRVYFVIAVYFIKNITDEHQSNSVYVGDARMMLECWINKLGERMKLNPTSHHI